MNKETWITIKKEYQEGLKIHSNTSWTCSLSDTFSNIWELNSEKIKEYARIFLVSNNIEGWCTGNIFLFRPDSAQDYLLKDAQNIRLQFLDYMINQYE